VEKLAPTSKFLACEPFIFCNPPWYQCFLLGSVLNLRVAEEVLDGVEVPREDDVEAEQIDMQQMVPASGAICTVCDLT
jgi:hypothetical protein